jgi:hypothetical protein
MIFIRTVFPCPFFKCVFIAVSLVGLHLIEPFVELVMISNQMDLQTSLPALYLDLKNHVEVAKRAINTAEPAIPSLAAAFSRCKQKKVYKAW